MSVVIMNYYVTAILLGMFMYCLIYSSPQPFEVLLPPLLTGGETETDEVVKSHLMIGDKIMMLIWICPSPET